MKRKLDEDLKILSQSLEDYEKLEDYKFCAILYEDSENYKTSLDSILNYALPSYFDKYFYIKHDKDVNINGELKKSHYHVVLVKSSPSTIGIVSKQLGIPANYVQRCETLKGSVTYLTHEEITDKISYGRDEIITNCISDISKYFKSDNDSDNGKAILEYILENNCTTVTEVAVWATEQGYYGAFRRGFALFNSVIRENNALKKSR